MSSLRQSVGDLSATLLSILRTRLELFALEAADQKARLVAVALLAAGGLLMATLALLVASLAVALYFWPTPDRYLALTVLALVYAVLAGGCVWQLRRTMQGPAPFEATLEELRADIALLARLRDRPGQDDDEDDEVDDRFDDVGGGRS